MSRRLSPRHMEWKIPATVWMDFSSRTPDELFEVLLSDYRSYEELRLTKGCREVTEEDERQAEILCQSFRERWKEEEK